MSRALLLLALLAACEADLGARRSPVTDGSSMAGQAILFGQYDGLLRVGATGPDFALSLVADDCGASLSGSVTSPTGETAALTGAREGSALVLDFEGPALTGQLDGRVVNARVLSGTWATDAGQGGSWTAVYVEGSVDDHPCPTAEKLLEETPR